MQEIEQTTGPKGATVQIEGTTPMRDVIVRSQVNDRWVYGFAVKADDLRVALEKELGWKITVPIAEPRGSGAVVLDTEGFRWVRVGARWQHETTGVPPAAWTAINVAEVLSEGVQL